MVKKQEDSVAQPQNAPEYLQRYSKEHLLYEVQMFFQVGHLLMTGQFQTSQPEVAIVLHNAIMESFVLHLRNLLDFFYTPPRKTDASATLFYDSGHLPPDFPTRISHSEHSPSQSPQRNESHNNGTTLGGESGEAVGITPTPEGS
jgi:hypothetical protein